MIIYLISLAPALLPSWDTDGALPPSAVTTRYARRCLGKQASWCQRNVVYTQVTLLNIVVFFVPAALWTTTAAAVVRLKAATTRWAHAETTRCAAGVLQAAGGGRWCLPGRRSTTSLVRARSARQRPMAAARPASCQQPHSAASQQCSALTQQELLLSFFRARRRLGCFYPMALCIITECWLELLQGFSRNAKA